MKNIILSAILLLSGLHVKAQFSDVVVAPIQKDVGICIVPAGTNDSTFIVPIKYTKIKSSGGIAAALSYGIAKVKAKCHYQGGKSPNRIRVGDKFVFKFGDVPDRVTQTYYMFAPNYSIKNFSLCKFDEKKDRRELTTVQIGIWSGTETGTSECRDVSFEVTTVAPGIYEATITSAYPGEYCFVFADNGEGAYQSVFDFSILPGAGSKTKKQTGMDDLYY